MPLDILPYMSLSLINWWLYSRGRLIIGTVAFSFPHHKYGPTSGPQCDERPAIRHAAFPLPTVDRPGAPARRMSNSSTLARLPGCRDSEGIRYGDWSWQWFYKPWRCSFWHLILIINIFFIMRRCLIVLPMILQRRALYRATAPILHQNDCRWDLYVTRSHEIGKGSKGGRCTAPK